MKKHIVPDSPSESLTPHIRRLVWLNIAFQVAFPLAVAFTPAIAGAGSDSHFLKAPASAAGQQTRVYTLTAGETVATVAAKYNMSVAQLRKLNEFRTFAHGFDHLQAGDELDVPPAPLPAVQWDDGKPGTLNADAGDAQAQRVASAATMAGGFLSANPNGDAAASMARGMASGAASGEVQQWLSQFGTARVQLGVDEDFSLKNSQLDLLVPLYDQGSSMVFTQGSVHRTDDRTQANLGAGMRYFTPTYMVGGNLFGDYDLSRDHARAGAGVEYWRDFLKLGANGYLRLTNWKDSPDLADYEERPANGWDIRAQAWLPALPQIGGKLTYEQYYGDEVALFGVDNRQRNPHAITAGVNYTPVPLVTLSAEQKQGQSGANDTRFGIEMNYQLGVPWRSQVDPDAVAALRSLTGSRYDLVERNNNIVLEYRKKEVIRLHTADLVTGYGGEQKSLGVSVTSKYGLKTIEWNAATLEAAGGKIVQTGADYAVVLPAYQATRQDGNSYTVSGVAVDMKGNRSDRSETQVTVQAPAVSSANSTFTPATSTLSADGKSAQVLTLTVKDDQGGAIDVPLADITLDVKKAQGAAMKAKAAATNTVISALTSGKNKGEYVVTVTAGTLAEEVTLTPVVQGVTLTPAKVSIISAVPAQANSIITTDKTNYTAGDTMTVTVTLKDASGNPVTGQAALLTGTTVTVANATLKSGSNWTETGTTGVYTATYTAGTAGTGLVATLKFADWGGNKQSAAYAIDASTVPAETNSVITRDKDSYTSGDDMVVTVTLKDAANNAVTGQAAQLTATTVTVANATLKSGSSWTETGTTGVYTATYTAGTAGTGLVATLKFADWGGNKQSAAYAIVPASPKQIDVNGYTFRSDQGFPTTGFRGAEFTLVPSVGSAADYNWSADASWVSVTNGVATFADNGTGKTVTITGTPKNGTGAVISYAFTLKSWFITNVSSGQGANWAGADSYCKTQPGYSLPTVQQLNGSANYAIGTRGTLSGMWSEWGDVSAYPAWTTGFIYWSSEVDASNYYRVNMETGTPLTGSPDTLYRIVCRQDL